MHNEACDQLGLDYTYLAFDVPEEKMPQAVEGLRTMGARGWNITMPGKNIMCRLADKVSPASEISGACNTIVNDNGVLTAYTTDGVGYIYSELDFNEVLEDGCDSYARYMVRMREIEESVKILEQLVDNIPEGDIRAQVPKIIKLPEGRWYQQVEASRGTFGVFIESTGQKTPWRVHFQSPCFNLVGVMDLCCANYMIADLITIGAALDFVIPDIDR